MNPESELFPPELLQAAALCRPAPENGGMNFSAGRHRSPYRGDSAEFQDYRAYVPGDDLRRVDWNIFRRSRKLLLRQYRNFPQKKHRIILDGSASIRFRNSRAQTVWRLAALLGGTLLCSGDGVTLSCADRIYPFAPGRPALAGFISALLEEYRRPASAAPSFRFPAGCHNWLISDFMDPAGLTHLEKTFMTCRGFTPVRIFEQSELHPEWTGEIRLTDAESRAEITVSPEPEQLKRYQEQLKRFEKLLEIPARRAESRVLAFDAGLPVSELIRCFQQEFFPEVQK